MLRSRFPWPVLALLVLAACSSRTPGSAGAGDYVGGHVALECAPFARALSGVRLAGPAADWWWEAQGHYARDIHPEIGSVLVLQRTDRLPSGHVAVVSRVLSPREILVTQANWVRHRVTSDLPVIDMSAAGDWSLVRMWWPPSGQMGITDYPAYGFIRATRPASHAALLAATPGAIRLAQSGW